jgi:hypothetical protein
MSLTPEEGRLAHRDRAVPAVAGARRRLPMAALPVAGLLGVLLLQGWAITRQSLTSDEAYHSLAGQEADSYGQNGLNLEHPPLFKMMAALPQRLAMPRLLVSSALANLQLLYVQPGAEARARIAGRLALAAVFGLPFLGLAFLLGREVGGNATGAVLALLLGLDFSVFPLLPLIYSDAAAAVAFGLGFLAIARFLRRPDLGSAVLLGLSCGLALAAKFTGLLLLPVATAALVLAPGARAAWRRRLLAGLAALAVAAAAVELTYFVADRRYDPAFGRETIRLYCANRATIIVGDLLQPRAELLLAIERHDPRAAQWLTGLLATRAQNELAVYPACNFGHMSSRGHWWYFPLLLAAKTPLPLLLASAAAAAACAATAWAARRAVPAAGAPVAAAPASPVPDRRFRWLLAAAAAIYLGVAMTSNYNAGLRHLLPILPLLYLPAARWAAARPWVAAALLGAMLVESLAMAPVWVSSTSTWWLGERDPLRFSLSLDNVYYHQNLLALREVRDRRGLRPLAVLDPSLPAAQVEAYLGKGASLTPASAVPSGWVAVGVATEVALPAILRSSPREMYGYSGYRSLAAAWLVPARAIARRAADCGYVAGTFHLYRLPMQVPAAERSR